MRKRLEGRHATDVARQAIDRVNVLSLPLARGLERARSREPHHRRPLIIRSWHGGGRTQFHGHGDWHGGVGGGRRSVVVGSHSWSTEEEQKLVQTPQVELLGIKHLIKQDNLQWKSYIGLLPQSHLPSSEMSQEVAGRPESPPVAAASAPPAPREPNAEMEEPPPLISPAENAWQCFASGDARRRKSSWTCN